MCALRCMIGSVMPHAWKEREDLAKADLDIAAGERRVAEQIALIEQMTRKGQNTTEASRLLRNYDETLEQFRFHRQLILDEIARQEGPDPSDIPDP